MSSFLSKLIRLGAFVKSELSRESRPHGTVIVYLAVADLISSVFYMALGFALIALARTDGKAVGDWLHPRLNETYLEPYGRMLVRWMESGHTIPLLAAASIAYGLIGFIVLAGLYYRRKWAEYVLALASIIYMPVEFYSMVADKSVYAAGLLALHAFVVWYLCSKKGLFSDYRTFDVTADAS